jgi:hypothetical protein
LAKKEERTMALRKKGTGGGRPVEEQRAGFLFPPGGYHVECRAVDEADPSESDPDGQDVIVLTFYTHAGVDLEGNPVAESDLGKRFRQWVRALTKDGSDKAEWGVFAFALGLITREQLEGDGEYEINWADAVGRQAVAVIEQNDYNPQKPSMRIAFNSIYRLEEEGHDDIPRDPLALADGGYAPQAAAPAKPADKPKPKPKGNGMWD